MERKLHRCMNKDLYIEIRNKTSVPKAFATNSYNLVRNYHSPQSKAMRQREWFTRLYMHMLMHPKTRAYMVTLTYNDVCIPSFNSKLALLQHGHINPNRSDYQKENIPCFSTRDIQLFIKKLRKKLTAYDTTFKYIICSEYGECFTKRSHYHGILFVDGEVKEELFFRMVRNSWSMPLTKRKDGIVFPLGNVYFSKNPLNCSYLCDNPAALRYTTKYVTKDMYFLNDNRYKNLSYDDKKKFPQPFHLQSTNFGHEWYKHFDVKKTLLEGFEVTFVKNGQKVTRNMPCPQYCIQDLFFGHKYTKAKDCIGQTVILHQRYLRKSQLNTYLWYMKENMRRNSERLALKYEVPQEQVKRSLMWGQIRTTLFPSYQSCDKWFQDINYIDIGYQRPYTNEELETLFEYVVSQKTYVNTPTYEYDGVKVLVSNGWIPLNMTPAGEIEDDSYFDIMGKIAEEADYYARDVSAKWEQAKHAKELVNKYPTGCENNPKPFKIQTNETFAEFGCDYKADARTYSFSL
ncbi:MAG: replication initiator protein [Microvirus sp.]|nr:MAG: replication initiator protein [Microvirus sp.]